MRIAYVIIDCNGREGTSIAVEQIMHRMADRGHDVHLFSNVATGADLTRITWHPVRAWSDPSVLRFRSFLHNCSRSLRHWRGPPFDIVHSAGCNTAGANVFQVQNVQPAKKQVLEKHGEFKGGNFLRCAARNAYYRVTMAAESRLYRTQKDPSVGGVGDRIHYLPVSLGTKRELTTHYGLTESNMTVIPNGVDLSRFCLKNQMQHRASIRARHGVSEGDLLMLFAGGEWRRKGLHHAIDALRHISAPKFTDAKLLVIGGDATKSEFVEQARRNCVLDKVVFAGFQTETERYYAASDLFVFPTYYEAFSLATLEAAASGLPIISALTNGTEELLRPGVVGEMSSSGALVERDGVAIARAVNRIADDEKLMRSMSWHARRITETEYNWDSIADRVELVYKNLGSPRTPAA